MKALMLILSVWFIVVGGEPLFREDYILKCEMYSIPWTYLYDVDIYIGRGVDSISGDQVDLYNCSSTASFPIEFSQTSMEWFNRENGNGFFYEFTQRTDSSTSVLTLNERNCSSFSIDTLIWSYDGNIPGCIARTWMYNKSRSVFHVHDTLDVSQFVPYIGECSPQGDIVNSELVVTEVIDCRQVPVRHKLTPVISNKNLSYGQFDLLGRKTISNPRKIQRVIRGR